MQTKFGVGKVVIELPKGSSNVSVEGGVGEIVFIVPDNVKIDFKGNVGIGEVEGLEKFQTGDFTAKVHVELGIGKVKFLPKW